MFYEIDVRKHNDKHIKRAAKDAKKVVRGKGCDLSLVCTEFIFLTKGPEAIKAACGLDLGF